MPLVRVRIMLGSTPLGAPARVFPTEASIEVVLTKAFEKFQEVSCKVLDVFPSPREEAKTVTQFYPESFGNVSLQDLHAYGYTWVAHVEREGGMHTPAATAGSSTAAAASGSSGGGGGSSTGLPNSMESMMERELGNIVTWPPPAVGETFYVRVYNALLQGLKAEGLGWHHADAGPDGSGTKLLKALAHALQYALPYDIKGALARRAMHVPDRFTADALQVRRLSRHVRSSCPLVMSARVMSARVMSALTAPSYNGVCAGYSCHKWASRCR